MANCPLCGRAYAPAAGKAVNPEYKNITICQQCYLDRNKYTKCVTDKDYESASRIYAEWEEKLDKNCKDENTRNILIEGLSSSPDEKVDQFRAEVLEKRKQQAIYMKKIESFKLTSGYNFEGYRITKYHRLISASTVLGTGLLSEVLASWSDTFGVTSNAFELKMDKAKEISHQKLAIAADQIGANAIIGVDFDYLTLGNNMIAVSANGTAVTIEPV